VSLVRLRAFVLLVVKVTSESCLLEQCDGLQGKKSSCVHSTASESIQYEKTCLLQTKSDRTGGRSSADLASRYKHRELHLESRLKMLTNFGKSSGRRVPRSFSKC